MEPWKRLDDGSHVTRAAFRSVVHKQFAMNNGTHMQADVVDPEKNEAVIVIPLTEYNTVLIARQFRCGPEKVLDELPGGIVDPGENIEKAARRELLEETGYEPGEMIYIGKSYVNAWSNTLHHFFLAKGCKKIHDHTNPDQHEEIVVDEITIKQLFVNAMTARMTDAIAPFLAYDTLKSLQGER